MTMKFLRRTITQLGTAAEDFGNVVTARSRNADQTELTEVISKSTDPIPSLNISMMETMDNRCRNTDDLLAYMETTEIMSKLKDSENVLMLKIQVSECLNELTEETLNELCSFCQRKSIVILLTIRSEFKCIVYWKSKDIQHFYTIMHYKDDWLWEDREVYNFVAEFLGDSLKVGELGISKKLSSTDLKDHQNHKRIDINDLRDLNNYNILLLASIHGNADVVEILIQIGMSTEHEDTNAQNLAWQNRHSDVLLVFAQSDLPYPNGIDISQLSDPFQRFYSTIEEFHEAIQQTNNTKVRKFISQNSKLKHFYNLSNETAASTALQYKSFDIYEVLLTNNIYPLDHESKIMKQFSKEEQRQIREIHINCSKNLRDRHINILMSNSYVSHHAQNEREMLGFVRNAYETLSQDERIDIVMQVVATSDKLKIIYDFNSDSVDTVDPTASEYTEGNFYLNGRIFIGAKQLLSNQKKCNTLSTMAHELCHYAMDLIYKHKAKPYLHNDRKSQKEFDKLYKECNKNAEHERFIEIVYDSYRSEVHHAELIVRVPHLIALYQTQPQKLNEIINYFPKLFDYFDKRSMADMRKFLDGKELQSKKSSFGKAALIFLLVLSISMITAAGIHYYLTLENENYFNEFFGNNTIFTNEESGSSTIPTPELTSSSMNTTTETFGNSTIPTTELTSSSSTITSETFSSSTTIATESTSSNSLLTTEPLSSTYLTTESEYSEYSIRKTTRRRPFPRKIPKYSTTEAPEPLLDESF